MAMLKKTRILFSGQEKEWNSNPSLFQPHKMQIIAGRRDHCAVLSYLKALLISELFRYAIFQFSHSKVAVHCSAEYCLLTYFSFLP